MSPAAGAQPGDELALLRSFIDAQRATLLRLADGLAHEELHRPLPPSTITLGGLLHHLAYVEDWWFVVTIAGRPPTPPWEAVDWRNDRDWDWRTAVDHEPDVLRARLRDAVARSDEVLDGLRDAATDLGTPCARRGRRGGEISVRWVLLHMIEEYARHLGHGDLVREAVDGTTGL